MRMVSAIVSCVDIDLLCIVVLVILAAKASSVGFDRPIKNKLFAEALWFAAAAYAMDVLWGLHEAGWFSLGRGIGWLVNAAYFVLLELSAFSWFVYAEVVENKNILYDRRKFLLYSIPL